MTREQERAAAKRRYERREQARLAVVRRRQRRQVLGAVGVTAALVVAVGAVVLVNRSGDEDTVTTADASASASPSPLQTATVCPAPTDTATRTPDVLLSPPATLAAGATYTATLTTNCGDVVVALDSRAPATVSSFRYLADQGYFDGTPCHRLTTAGIFVLQCGDPTGTGTGGPGYVLPDENLPTYEVSNYPAGTVAMANAGPGTGGSQFFLVYDDTTLPSDYTVFGKITQGLDVLTRVAGAGTSGTTGDGTPIQPVTLSSVAVTEQGA